MSAEVTPQETTEPTPTLGSEMPTDTTLGTEPEVVETPPNWRDSLSPDLKSNPVLERFDNVEALAKEHINAQKLIGADKIAIPGENATEEERAAFYTRLGRPAKVEDYDLSKVEIPEGIEADEEFQTAMLEKMHARGASQQMVEGILSDYYEAMGSQLSQRDTNLQQDFDDGIKMLRNEWGKSYDGNVDLAKRAFVAAAGEKAAEFGQIKLENGQLLGNDARILKMFAEIGNRMADHGLVGAAASRSTRTPSEAASEKNKLLADPDFMQAYTDGQHLEHAAAVQKIQDLIEMEISERGE